MRTALKWIGIGLGALVLALALFLAFFDWNLLKGPIESLASNALGRSVEIQGDIDVDPSLTPRITAHDIRVDNPDWASAPHLATLDRLEFTLRLPALLRGDVVLPELRLSQPKIRLERNAQGQANWSLPPDERDSPKDESQGLPPIPRIGDLSVDDGTLTYQDPNTQLNLHVSTTEGELTGKHLELHAEGRMEGRPLNLDLTAGGLSALRSEGAGTPNGSPSPYPVDARLRLGEATATAKGTIQRPTEGQGFDIDLDAQGPDLSVLDPLAVGVSLAESPPFRMSGHLAGGIDQPRLENLRLELGDNLLTGRVGLNLEGERPYLSADLAAPRLDVGELAGWVQTGPGGATEPQNQKEAGPLPGGQLDLSALNRFDADVRFRSEDLSLPGLPIEGLRVHARLDHGTLTVEPFAADLASGAVDGRLVAKAGDREQPPTVRMDVDFRQVPLDILSPEPAGATPYSGRFTGSAVLAVQGSTPAALAESANGRVVIDNGEFAYRTPERRYDLDIGNAELDLGPNNVALTAQGRLEGLPLSVDLDAGGLARLRDGDRPYPLKGRVELGETTATVDGTLAQPLQAAGPDLSLSVRGPSLGDLDPLIAGTDLPKTPPYRLSGHLTGNGDRWAMRNLRLGLGDSTVQGRAALDLGGKRPYVSADLTSPRLELGELRDIFDTGEEEKKETPKAGLFPDEAYDLQALRTLDADLSFKSRNINAPKLHLQELQADARLDHGKLVVKPFKVGIGGGEITGSMTVDARSQPAYSSLDSELRLLRLGRFAPETPFTDELRGTLAGLARLYVVGNSPDAMAASANGTVTLLVEDGTVSHLLMELIGLDVAESLGLAVAGDEPIPIRCLAADFGISDGVMRTQPVVFDTTDTKIIVDGRIDLGRETLDLRIIPRPKDFSIFSARSAPIVVRGPIASPDIRPDLSDLALRGAASAALGALLSPLAAILPWIGPGTGEDSPCRTLIAAGAAGD